ncbi:ribbon-helix-helix protein, CopG family [Bradyrhizobium sp. 168]|nr:ribbon-helix-helix protein, CopG family [Bradyrhizobium sp. 168]
MSHVRSARFSALLQIRAPEYFTEAVDRAADRRVQSRSDYVRAAVLDRLRADGIEVERGAA